MQQMELIALDPQKLALDAAKKYKVDVDKKYTKQTFLKLVKKRSPSDKHKFYKLSKSLEELAISLTQDEYNMLVEMYAFRFYFGHSVITAESLAQICKFVGTSKVLEIGAGNGYIGFAMKLSGIDIVLTDIQFNDYPSLKMIGKQPWTEIIEMDNITALKKYTDVDCLMLIWPPPGSAMAYDSLRKFNGSKFIYIGEWVGGQSGTIDFFNELKDKWTREEKFTIPNFIATFDEIHLFTRKKKINQLF